MPLPAFTEVYSIDNEHSTHGQVGVFRIRKTSPSHYGEMRHEPQGEKAKKSCFGGRERGTRKHEIRKGEKLRPLILISRFSISGFRVSLSLHPQSYFVSLLGICTSRG